MAPRLKERYDTEIRPALSKELGIPNPMALPRLTKIVVNMGVGSAVQDKKHLELAVDAMTDLNADAHDNSIRRIFPRLGETATTDEIRALLGQGSSQQ